jgi:hypothetical protein
VRLVGLATKIGDVQLHETFTAFAVPVKTRVAVKPLLGQEPRVLLAREMATCTDWPGVRVPLAGLKLTKKPLLENPLLEVDQSRLVWAEELLLTVAVQLQL